MLCGPGKAEAPAGPSRGRARGSRLSPAGQGTSPCGPGACPAPQESRHCRTCVSRSAAAIFLSGNPKRGVREGERGAPSRTAGCSPAAARAASCPRTGVFATLCERLTVQRVLLDSTLGMNFLRVTVLFFNIFFLLLVVSVRGKHTAYEVVHLSVGWCSKNLDGHCFHQKNHFSSSKLLLLQ